jgi:hypothetical protein
MSTLDRDAWLEKLESIAAALPATGEPVKICLIGSGACLLEAGMPGRASHDLDVWLPASKFDMGELRRAVMQAGLLFDPRSSLEPDQPYVQIVNPGPTQVGSFEPVFWAQFGRLHVYLPPWPNWVAAKLARGEPRDVEDVLYVAKCQQISPEEVEACAASFPESSRRQVLENLIYLRILEP